MYKIIIVLEKSCKMIYNTRYVTRKLCEPGIRRTKMIKRFLKVAGMLFTVVGFAYMAILAISCFLPYLEKIEEEDDDFDAFYDPDVDEFDDSF